MAEDYFQFFRGKPADSFNFKDIIYEKKNGLAKVILNRPQVFNSYSLLALKEMAEAFNDASFDDEVAVLILTGAGTQAFCTGGDVKEYSENYTKRPRDFWKWMGVYQLAHDRLRNLGKPVIARVNGVTAGGGNEFHLSCDLSIAAEHATFLQVGTRVGSVAAGGATQHLPILIGDRRAREMLFLCERISAEKALQWGLVNQVVPSLVDESGKFITDPEKKAQALSDLKNARIDLSLLDKAVEEMANKLIDKFPECTRYTKQQVNFWKDLSWYMTIGHARDWLSVHFASPETREGMFSFVEKRPTDYRRLRKLAAEGKSPEFLWGPYTKSCGKCGTKGIPEEFDYCGKCGWPLAVDREP